MVSRGWISVLHGAAAYAAISTACVAAAPAHAQNSSAQSIAFDIPAGSLQSALAVFARQSGLQLIYAPEAVAGQQVRRLHASLSAQVALQRLLADSGLHARQIDSKVIVLEKRRAHDATSLRTSPGSVSSGSAALDAASITRGPSPERDGEEPARDIIVTGTNIRGEAPTGSAVLTIKRAQMEQNGYGTVAQALQAMPGNFGGTTTEQSALALSDRSGTNTTLSTGVNLRGLGAAATLVLVNGHRIAGSGTLGDFADVSNIPMSAVDRIEVLMDGASAIYGSDAVGGVVNIIMKDRFDGFETGARLGTVTKGGSREIQAYQTAGTSWSSGSAYISYEYYHRTPLLAADRRFARSADSRPLGGTDHRYIYSSPGNVLGFDPVTGSLQAAYAIPAGHDSTKLQPGDFIAGSPNLEDFQIGSYLVPEQTRHSVYALAHQDLGDNVHLSLEGRFTRRDFDSRSGGYATILTVTRNNPWFVSPTGQSSDLIGYSFGRDLGPTRDQGWSETFGFTGGIDVDLPAGWKLAAYAGYARSREFHRTENIANESILAEALGTVPDDPATAFNAALDGYFNPYGDGTANPPAILAAIGGFIQDRYNNAVTVGNLQADGSLFHLPAGAVRVAIGANVRHEDFESQSASFFVTPTPSIGNPVDRGRTITAAFAEARIPLFGRDNAQPGLQRLDVSIAGRIEHYPDFGTTANPKFGLSWSPASGLTMRGTYGTSFRAPNLGQLRESGSVGSTILTNASGASVLVLQLSGGNPDLKPERARSWTLGVDIDPPALPGLHINGTLFRTIFDRRIDRPAGRSFSTALTNPDLAPFVRFVTPATNPADRDYVARLISELSGGAATFPVDSVSAIVDTRYVNTTSTDVRGIDFSIDYKTQVGRDTVSLDANGTYLLAWRQRTTPTSVAIDERNLSGWPVDFRGRLTAVWRHGRFDTTVGLNYVGSYRDAVTGAPIGSWTTVDARVAWSAPKNGLIGDATIALSVQNLFDADPPFYNSTAGVGFDAANADATGRFVSLQITKRW